MTEPRRPPRPPADMSELVGEDVPPAEVERLRHVDRMLRSVPAPPELPPSLARPAAALAGARERLWTRRRVVAAVALAAALSALFFGVGMRVGGGDGFDERAAVPMEATSEARGASALIRLGEPDAHGNWPLRLEVSGLPPLPRGGYYVLWLARGGEYGGTCGTFRVADDGTAEVDMSASYQLREFDAWVVTARHPGDPPDAEPRWLLEGEIPRT
jgi:Anti-sigma-K factor rskA